MFMLFKIKTWSVARMDHVSFGVRPQSCANQVPFLMTDTSITCQAALNRV